MFVEVQVVIDAVYTWVDGSDPNWLRKKNDAMAALDPGAEQFINSATGDARFFNRDELRYSLRSLDLYAPFIRKIFIVTDQQIPSWLNVRHPRIEMVFHHSIFPDCADLPCFNSHAIETNLHRIEGLSERFIYLNDDFAFFQPASESDFFDRQGRAIVYFDRRKVQRHPWWFGYHSPVNAAARNNSRVLESRSIAPISRRLDHVPYALQKSVLEELWSLFYGELKATSSHQFRHRDDLSTASSLAQHFALATGKAVTGTMDTNAYIKIKKLPLSGPLVRFRLKRLQNRTSERPRFVSINDAGRLDQSLTTQRAIVEFFETVFPNKSQFER